MLARWPSIFKWSRNLGPVFISKRCKVDKRETLSLKKTNSQLALDHFDTLYGKFYGKQLWSSIRLSILSQPKYCALVNYYGDYEATIQMLRDLGCVDIQEVFEANHSNISGRRTSRKRTIHEQLDQGNDESPQDTYSSDDRIINPDVPSGALHNFVPATKLKGMEDWVSEEDQLKYLKKSPDFVVDMKPDDHLVFPSLLKAFTFVRGDVSRFPQPKRTSLGTFNYYLMDAASLLPVLALNLEPLDSVLDLCAAPGGKTLAILQTVYPSRIVCNDLGASRIGRLRSVLDQYLGKTQTWNDRLEILNSDALAWSECDAFDKVLVDVPCTTDRHSVTEDDNNLFKPTRIKERIKLPETQTALLCAGVRACKPGGTVVYSTCSLSPIQNDGVVYMALKKLKEAYDIDTVVNDLRTTVQGFDFLSRFAPAHLMRYGQVVLPSLPNNFGPMYISKITRIK